MACITCKGIDQYLYIADCFLSSLEKDLGLMQHTINEKNIGHGMRVSVALMLTNVKDIREYIGRAIDRSFSGGEFFTPVPDHQETPSESEVEDLYSDDDLDEDSLEVEEIPGSPVFRPASDFLKEDVTPLTTPPASPPASSSSASSTLPRSDACGDLSSLSGPLKKIKQVNEELAKKNPGTFISPQHPPGWYLHRKPLDLGHWVDHTEDEMEEIKRRQDKKDKKENK